MNNKMIYGLVTGVVAGVMGVGMYLLPAHKEHRDKMRIECSGFLGHPSRVVYVEDNGYNSDIYQRVKDARDNNDCDECHKALEENYTPINIKGIWYKMPSDCFQCHEENGIDIND